MSTMLTLREEKGSGIWWVGDVVELTLSCARGYASLGQVQMGDKTSTILGVDQTMPRVLLQRSPSKNMQCTSWPRGCRGSGAHSPTCWPTARVMDLGTSG